MNNNKIKDVLCLPIQDSDADNVSAIIKENINNYRYFEVWIDYLEEKAIDFLKSHSPLLNDRLIIIFRRKNWDKTLLPKSSIEQIISISLQGNFMVDFDVVMQNKTLEEVSSTFPNLRLITSFHDYEKTPTLDYLSQQIENMDKFNPYIYKFSCYCNSHNDAYRLLGLCFKVKSQNKRVISLGMGRFGKVTRLAGTVWGNEFVFTPTTTAKQSAPGQISRDEIVKALNIFI